MQNLVQACKVCLSIVCACAVVAVNKEWWAWVNEDPKIHFYIQTFDPVNDDKYVSAALQKGQRWDPYVYDLFIRVLSDKKNLGAVVDIGANIGYFTLISASLSRTVYSFEPMERNYIKLNASMWRNAYEDRIILFPYAASESAHNFSMSPTDKANKGNGRIVVHEQGTAGVVQGYPVDVLVPRVPIALVKLDVEGWEPYAMRGARETMCNARFITLELSDAGKRNNILKELQWLEDNGFLLSDITQDAEIFSCKNTLLDNMPPNILATRVGNCKR